VGLGAAAGIAGVVPFDPRQHAGTTAAEVMRRTPGADGTAARQAAGARTWPAPGVPQSGRSQLTPSPGPVPVPSPGLPRPAAATASTAPDIGVTAAPDRRLDLVAGARFRLQFAWTNRAADASTPCAGPDSSDSSKSWSLQYAVASGTGPETVATVALPAACK